jgi:Fe-S oxidoreductase
MWQGNELNGTERMSEIRAKEAIGTGAEVLVTACPLCLIMMEDAIKSLGHDKKIKVMDLNELVLEAIA